MADNNQLKQLLQALIEKLITNVQSPIFTGAEAKDILSWWNKTQGQSIPLYLYKFALVFCNLLPVKTKSNQQLVKQALATQYHSHDEK